MLHRRSKSKLSKATMASLPLPGKRTFDQARKALPLGSIALEPKAIPIPYGLADLAKVGTCFKSPISGAKEKPESLTGPLRILLLIFGALLAPSTLRSQK